MINSSNTLRVSGLASGMNTDEIVANLVKVQSARLNKLMQNKISMTWKSDAYRDVNKKVDEFRRSMEALRLDATFNKQSITSSDPKVAVSSATQSTQTDFEISQSELYTAAKPAIISINSGGKDISENFSFTLGDGAASTAITLTSGITLDKAVEQINTSATNNGVKVTASNVGGSLVFTSVNKGMNQSISITGTTTNTLGITDQTSQGSDAKPGSVTINGTVINTNSNTFTYEGVTFTLKDKIDPLNDPSVFVQVGSDTEGVFKSIQTFVDKYNDLIADLNGRLTEKHYRDYPPLLDDQKKEMKESEIKLWDEKARSGLLSNDSTIRNFLAEMRNSLNEAVQNSGLSASFQSLRDIGIEFSKNYRDHGKLVLDESKLKGILQTNLKDVRKMFTTKVSGTTTTDNTTTNPALHQQSGFGWRIYDRLNFTISELGSLAGSPDSLVDTKSMIARQLKALDANIDREKDSVNSYEKGLWRQFTAMEKALSQLNSQSSWLSQQIGMM